VYERSSQPVISLRAFLIRLARHGVLALLVIAASLVIGMLGYISLAGMNAVDAFLNASMILGGMGPVRELTTDGSKIFAGVYALYSGVVFLVVAGILLAPVVHRIMHSLHVDEAGDKTDHDAIRGPA
jgi:hypothetical protein